MFQMFSIYQQQKLKLFPAIAQSQVKWFELLAPTFKYLFCNKNNSG